VSRRRATHVSEVDTYVLILQHEDPDKWSRGFLQRYHCLDKRLHGIIECAALKFESVPPKHRVMYLISDHQRSHESRKQRSSLNRYRKQMRRLGGVFSCMTWCVCVDKDISYG
jgi:hypothetical protein